MQFPAAELVLRSGIDVALRGRYLLVSPDAGDELQRMHGAYVKRKQQLSKSCGDGKTQPVPLAFAAAVPPSAQKERDLFVVAEAIDALGKTRRKRTSTATWAYRCLYQWMSNAAAHSGLYAVERFTVETDGKAAVTTRPESLSNPERRHYVQVAAQLGALAREVFTAYGLPLDDLDATGVRLP